MRSFLTGRGIQSGIDYRACLEHQTLTPNGVAAKAEKSLQGFKCKLAEYEALKATIGELKAELGEAAVEGRNIQKTMIQVTTIILCCRFGKSLLPFSRTSFARHPQGN